MKTKSIVVITRVSWTSVVARISQPLDSHHTIDPHSGPHSGKQTETGTDKIISKPSNEVNGKKKWPNLVAPFSSSGVFGHSLPAGNYTTLLGPLHF